MASEKSPPRHGGNKSNGIDRKNISNYYRRCKLAIGDEYRQRSSRRAPGCSGECTGRQTTPSFPSLSRELFGGKTWPTSWQYSATIPFKSYMHFASASFAHTSNFGSPYIVSRCLTFTAGIRELFIRRRWRQRIAAKSARIKTYLLLFFVRFILLSLCCELLNYNFMKCFIY